MAFVDPHSPEYDPWEETLKRRRSEVELTRLRREQEALQRDEPRFGTFGTMSPEQMSILGGLQAGQAPTFQPPSVPGVATQFEPVGVTGAGRYQPVPTAGAEQFQPVSVGPGGQYTPAFGGAGQTYAPVGVGAAAMPTEARPTYGAMAMGGAGERAGMLSRMMGVSPEQEAEAIQAMSQPAMRQFREEILPETRGQFLGTGTAWSTMRAGEEAGAGVDLAERLAAMGEQYRMQRRSQAMQAGGQSLQEAQAGVQAGLARYGTEMQPYMQAQGMVGQEAMQRQALGAQTGVQAQQLGAQSALVAMQERAQAAAQAQRLTSGEAMQSMQAQTQAGMQAQQLGAQSSLAARQAQAQTGMQAQQLGSAEAMQAMQARTQAGMTAQQLGAQGGIANLQAQMQAALQSQQLGAQTGMSRENMLAQLLGIPMMGVYSY